MANRDPYRQTPSVPCTCCLPVTWREFERQQSRRARHGAALTIAYELDQHASGIETDRFEGADWGPEDDPWQACWGEYAEPLTLPKPFATLADVA